MTTKQVCNCDNIEYDSVYADGDYAWQQAKCLDCGRKWNEIYIRACDEEITDDN